MEITLKQIGELIENFSYMPFSMSFILGILLSISACTATANVAAMSMLCSRTVGRKSVIFRGAGLSFGRSVIYVLVALIVCPFYDSVSLSHSFETAYGFLAGLMFVMTGAITVGLVHIHGLQHTATKFLDKHTTTGVTGSVVMGMILALAICPYSAMLYFGMMLPLGISTHNVLLVSLMFSLGVSVPILLLSVLWAFGKERLYEFKNKVKGYEKIARWIIGILFVLTGLLFWIEYIF